MADTRISDLTALTGASLASTDLAVVVDVSDTSMASSGTDKKTTVADLATAITSVGALATTTAVAAGYQPLDSDLTAIAALTTTTYGRAFLALADAAAARTALSLGTAAVADTGTGASNVPTITQADARYQATDTDLTALAGLAGVQGDIIYRDATQWQRLAAGTSGQVLQTGGAGANPAWATASGGGGSVATDTIFDAKGDLPVGTGADTAAKLTVGTNGWTLAADSSQSTGLIWSDPSLIAHGVIRTRTTGYYIPDGFSTVANTVQAQGAGDTRYARFQLATTAAVTFDRIGIEITTLGASAVCRLGIYAINSSGKPGSLILDAGTVDASSTGVKEITISQSLTPGAYWLCAAMQVATASIKIGGGATIRSNWHGFSSSANAIGNGNVGLLSTGITGALASTPTVSDGDSVALIFLRAA